MRAFITGGAGFIGSNLVAALLRCGAEVQVFDSLHPQVHGPKPHPPETLAGAAFCQGDVADRTTLQRALNAAKPDLVFHLAAETGTGQSLHEAARYCSANVMGTANLIEALRAVDVKPRRVVLASSRAIYGEGAYRTSDGQTVVPAPRTIEALGAGCYVPQADDGEELRPIATPEDVPLRPGSVYAATKLMQEHLLLCAAEIAPWDATILRFQNVYGPGQSLNNPYTGVLSIFAHALLAGRHLDIFEDGAITRDFVFVDDVVDALIKAATSLEGVRVPLNIGTGQAVTIFEAATILAAETGRLPTALRITGEFRPGDARYAVADTRRAEEMLGWRAVIPFAAGASVLVEWARRELGLLTAASPELSLGSA